MKSGCLTVVLLLVSIISIGGNVLLLRNAGSTPTLSAETLDSQVSLLARSLGLRVPPGRKDCDILTDIRLWADGAERAPSDVLSQETVSELSSVLTADECRQLGSGLAFLRRISGRKFLILNEESEK